MGICRHTGATGRTRPAVVRNVLATLNQPCRQLEDGWREGTQVVSKHLRHESPEGLLCDLSLGSNNLRLAGPEEGT